jgi:quercetin dioxygenase-like cupin family protein
VLHVTEGAGLVQRRSGAVEAIRVGDSVRIAPGEWHWHGAAPTTFMTHLAIQEVAEDGTEAERGAAVTDTEYLARPLAV